MNSEPFTSRNTSQFEKAFAMALSTISEIAFEIAIERHLLRHGFVSVTPDGFDRERAIFQMIAKCFDFIRDTQPKEWAKLEALHGAKTGEQILTDLCKWMDTYGSLATLHGTASSVTGARCAWRSSKRRTA